MPSQSYYDSVRALGGDIVVKTCQLCHRRLRAQLPYKDCAKPAIVCGQCDRGFDFPRIKAAA